MKINKADVWFSKFIRLRDADDDGYCTCITCGAVRHWKNLDCGHFIKRQFMSARYNEKNCNAQCKNCNNFEQGNDSNYERFILAKYGLQELELLRACKRYNTKFSKLMIDVLADEYKKKALELAKMKGIEL